LRQVVRRVGALTTTTEEIDVQASGWPSRLLKNAEFG